MKSKTTPRTKRSEKKSPARTPPPPTPASSPWPRRLLLILLAVLATGGAWAVAEFVMEPTIPRELVGKWVVVEGPQEGATFDFFRDGTMVGKVNLGGKEGIIKATVRVEGNKILSTTKNPQTGKDDTRTQVIRTLNDKELVVEDEQGKLLKMERAK